MGLIMKKNGDQKSRAIVPLRFVDSGNICKCLHLNVNKHPSLAYLKDSLTFSRATAEVH
jgi:hypothetical protein